MKTNRPGGLTLTRAALDCCNFLPGDRVLDAGCGFGATGRFLACSQNLAVTGLDRDMGRLAQAGSPVSPVCACLPHLPFAGGVFKGIFCECVLSLVPDKAGCLAAFFRVMQPGGTLVLADLYLPASVPRGTGEQGAETAGPAGTTCLDGALTREALARAVRAAGFHITLMEDHTRLLKEMACEMVFEHGSLEGFWEQLTGGVMPAGMTALCRAGRLKPGYAMVIARKHG